MDGSCLDEPGDETIYSFRAEASELLVASLVNPGTDFDTGISIRESECETGEEVACNDDFRGAEESHVAFRASRGTQYFVIVEGVEEETGDFELVVHRAGACNGVGPIQHITELIASGTTTINTRTGVHSMRGNCTGGTSPEGLLWFTAPRDGTIVASTNFSSSSYDSVLYVREGDCDARSAELTCNDDDRQPAFGDRRTNSEIEFEVTEGETYYILADGYGGAQGTAEFGLGYGGTSPVRGALAAGGYGFRDVYRVFGWNRTGLHVSADTVSAGTATDLVIEIHNDDGRIARFDDEVDCTFPPAGGGGCPNGTIRVPSTGFYYVVIYGSGVAGIARAEYRLSADRFGTALRLMQTVDH